MYHMVHRILATATSTAPAEQLFELLRDPTTWPAWSTMDGAAAAEPGADGPYGIGSTRTYRRGRVRGLDRVDELVPGRRFGYAHLHGLPVRDYRGTVHLEPFDGGTRITWQASFRPAVRGTGWFWRLALQRFLQQMARDLASAGTSGVDQDQRTRARARIRRS
jgi:hypothetical protein